MESTVKVTNLKLLPALCLAATLLAGAAPTHALSKKPLKKPAPAAKKSAAKPAHHTASKAAPRHGARATHSRTKPTPQSIKLTSAFNASAQLRPMAQQLAATRAPAAFTGVLNYASTHPGEAAATAYLALGHAYTLDHRYPEALNTFRQANLHGHSLDDYADYLGAQAALNANRPQDALPLLDHFADRHPGSIFATYAPILLAQAYLQQNDSHNALAVLAPFTNSPVAARTDFQYELARANQLAGNAAQATTLYRGIYTLQPLTFEASQARNQLQQMGAALSAGERKSHADQLFNARHYSEAADEYHAIQKNETGLSEADRSALDIYAAVCELKLKHISLKEAERLPNTQDDSAAAKLYILSELARNDDRRNDHRTFIDQMIRQYPKSRWLEEALYSGGNMYLVKHDYAQAAFHYTTLAQMFPNSTYAPSAHWHAAWLNYRTRNYSEAARLMDEQVQRYPAGVEVSAALYWRARILEDEEHNFPQAANYYRAITANYQNFYYADLARERIKVLGNQPAIAAAPALASVRELKVPQLIAELPENDPHLIKARLLANAALNEFIPQEIAAGDNSQQWGTLAQAEIYASYGEYTRALQTMKHSGISYFALSVPQVPQAYWSLLFPKPYWTDLVNDAERNNLDPYLVASLIRQESEFNPGAVSPARAYGLMQLLPSVGKSIARKQGIKGFNANALLNPSTNLQLGTTNLKQVLDRFNGRPEYALAAYNAGDVPVRNWLASNDYKDIPEFVESIPYTETRDYVQAILRNRELYRQLYPTH